MYLRERPITSPTVKGLSGGVDSLAKPRGAPLWCRGVLSVIWRSLYSLANVSSRFILAGPKWYSFWKLNGMIYLTMMYYKKYFYKFYSQTERLVKGLVRYFEKNLIFFSSVKIPLQLYQHDVPISSFSSFFTRNNAYLSLFVINRSGGFAFLVFKCRRTLSIPTRKSTVQV